MIACWWRGEVKGRAFEGVSFEEARALERPAMTIVRGQLRAPLAGRVHRAYWRWLHPTSGRRPGDTCLEQRSLGGRLDRVDPHGRGCPSGVSRQVSRLVAGWPLRGRRCPQPACPHSSAAPSSQVSGLGLGVHRTLVACPSWCPHWRVATARGHDAVAHWTAGRSGRPDRRPSRARASVRSTELGRAADGQSAA
jgi:hypothetical protein